MREENVHQKIHCFGAAISLEQSTITAPANNIDPVKSIKPPNSPLSVVMSAPPMGLPVKPLTCHY
jgi:hypothetical protein